MRNISTTIRGHYDDDRYMWAIIIRRFLTLGVEHQMLCVLSMNSTLLFIQVCSRFGAGKIGNKRGPPLHAAIQPPKQDGPERS
jgi:hypothetical protein